MAGEKNALYNFDTADINKPVFSSYRWQIGNLWKRWLTNTYHKSLQINARQKKRVAAFPNQHQHRIQHLLWAICLHWLWFYGCWFAQCERKSSSTTTVKNWCHVGCPLSKPRLLGSIQSCSHRWRRSVRITDHTSFVSVGLHTGQGSVNQHQWGAELNWREPATSVFWSLMSPDTESEPSTALKRPDGREIIQLECI